MANDNRKNPNPSKPDQRDGMPEPSRKQPQGGTEQVSRDQDTKDPGKPGEQEGMDRQQQSGRGQRQSQDAAKGGLGDDLDDDNQDVDVEDEDRITQRNPAQRPERSPDSLK